LNIEWIQLLNSATLTTPNPSLNDRHKKVEEVLKEHTMGTSKWVGYTNSHNSWVVEEELHANHLLKQFQASKSSETAEGRALRTVLRLVRGGESGSFPILVPILRCIVLHA